MDSPALTKIYDLEASIYDGRYLSALNATEDDIVAEFLRHFYKGGCRVLDIGCGTGAAPFLAGLHARDYVGVDLSREMIDVAQSKLPDHTFKRADADKFDGGLFDLVVSVYGPLNYIGLDPYLQILKRCLNGSGRFFSVVYTGVENGDVAPPRDLQKIYSADDIRKGFLAEGYDVEIRGFSHIGKTQDSDSYLSQMAKTLGPFEGEEMYKYMIVSSPLC
jgi:SAM-dependent methyltransferase